jgi:hypothetical protein
MAARQPVLNFLPAILSLLSFILILLILLAGTNNALSDFYYLKTDTTALSVPSKLSSSTFLSDLSAVSGADFTGSPATASSLGLADSYTLLLLTSCAHFPSGGAQCDRPSIGFTFNPASDLRLDSTSLQGTFPPALASALANYRRVSGFLAGAYVVSAALVALAPLASLLAARNRSAGAVAAVMSVLASILLLGAGIAAVVVFGSLNTQFNAAFSSSGLRSSLGAKPVALGFVAFALTLLTAVIFVVRARTPANARGRMVARSIGADDAASVATGKEGSKPGLWKRIPTWSQHRYVQVEKQPAVQKTKNVAASMEAVVVTSPAGTRARADGDEDWATGDDEYASGRGQKGIPMLSIGANKRERDMNTAYEPYGGASSGSS